MAHDMKESDASRNAANDARLALVSGGKCRIYTAPKPAGPSTAITTQTLLVEHALGSPAFGSSAAGVATINAVADATIVATGTGDWCRLLSSGGTAHIDLTVGVGSSFDVQVPTTSYAAGVTSQITGGTITQP